MAMVLDAFASYVQSMLTEMAREEVHMLLGVRDEIDKMNFRLKDLNNRLTDADRRNITDETVREWVAELKRAMYEAADILDLCQLKAMEQGRSTVDVGCFNPLLFCMRNPTHAHNIGTRIKALNNRLTDADRRNITDETVREWVAELKRAMYEAADILDLCQLKAMEQGRSTVDVGCFNPLLFCMRNPAHAHNIGTRIKALNNRLTDADRRNITDETVREWVAELKRAMYEAADILDLCQLKAMEQGRSTVDVGCFNPLLFCMRNPAHAHNIGTRIKALNNRLTDADRRNITNETVREWVAELKRAMYEAADILDLCQLKAMEQGRSTVDVGCFNPLLFCMRNPAHAHNIGTRIKALNNRLTDADRRNITDETVREWVAELKRAMYEAADILDLCQLKAMEQGRSTVDVGCFNPLLFCMRNPAHAHNIGTRIKALNNRLTDADRRNITDETVREWVAELKRAMYEAADILDLCQLKAMEQGRSTVDVGCFNPLLFCMRNPAHAHNIGTRIKALNNRLTDVDRRNITDETVREWVAELKRAMYEAADILDLCQLKAMEQGRSTVDVGCFNPLLFCMRNPAHAHNIGTRIKALNNRLGSIKERSATFSFINLVPYEDQNTRVHSSRADNPSRETSGEFDRLGVVGEKIEEDTRALVEILLSEKESNTNIMVVAIVGVGGIGKTTLAQKVFNDETMKDKFDKTIWLSIDQEFDKVDLIKTIITLGGGEHGGGTVLAVLQPILNTVLTGKKLFLVLDDVWSHKEWVNVLQTPLANLVARDSRVLITTRDERVARGMNVVIPYHHVDKLEDEDAWSLLKKQIVSSEADGREIDMLKDIGLRIVAKCDGLPLAIKVMGGLLCQRDRKQLDWEIILNDIGCLVSEMSTELNPVVHLSYEDLPPCIKQCFLLYSLLPKTRPFYDQNIIGMWISEGIIHGPSDNLEELGSKYYKELIVRNLIEPDTHYVDQCVCNMHDVVRSFGQLVGRGEALAAHSGETNIVDKLGAQKFLRLSLESKASESDGLDWSSLQEQTALRTLISVGHINMKPGDSVVHFPSLRTLDIDSAGVVGLTESLHKFKHLRYLSLKNSDISCLPDNIGKMKFLQYISLSGSKQFVKLPDSIVQLRQLRYLNFHQTSISGLPRGFCALTNLRIVSGFPVLEDGDWCSLEELGPLSQLRELGLQGLENVTDPSSASKAKLGEKGLLSDLYLTCGSRSGDDGHSEEEEQKKTEKVFDELCPPPNLYFLSIKGYFGQRLPRWMMSSSIVPLKNLRTLMVEDLVCCTKLPDGLCRLPYLELIQINHAPAIRHVGPKFLRSCHHHNLLSSQAVAVFPRLREMNLTGMVAWAKWEWEEQVQAFPVLQDLILTNCKLMHLPPGLASQASALNKLHIQNVKYLICIENFVSLVELEVVANTGLKRITNLPRLQKLKITFCPRLEVLEGIPALQKLLIKDANMKTLPKYMKRINPKSLELCCSQALVACLAVGKSGPEWNKFSHVQHVKAYAREGDNPGKWHVHYTADPYNLATNINLSVMSRGTVPSSEGTQGFESVFKMARNTGNYISSLVTGRQ